MPRVHEVKCRQQFFDDVASGRKTAELRLDDRGYEVGDTLRQREVAFGAGTGWEHYTGRVISHEITHKLTGEPWLAPGYCMLSLGRVPLEVSHD